MSNGKTRLNLHMRNRLRNLADTTVKDTPEEEKKFRAAHAAAVKEVIRCARAKWPEKDMKVLRKHACGYFRMEVLLVTDEEHMRQHHFKLVTQQMEYEDWDNVRKAADPKMGFWSPQSSNALQLDEKATDVLNEFWNIEAARSKRLANIINDLRMLIHNAKTLEQIESVWPAAMALRKELPVQGLPSVQLGDVMDRIRDAVANKNL